MAQVAGGPQQKAPSKAAGLIDEEPVIPIETLVAQFGEILLSSPESHGGLEPIEEFKGRKLSKVSGGFKRIFLFEEIDGNSPIIKRRRMWSLPCTTKNKMKYSIKTLKLHP